MKNNTKSRNSRKKAKFIWDVAILVSFYTLVAIFPLFLVWVISLIIEKPMGLNDITPDFMLLAFSLSCTVLFCIYKNNAEERFKSSLLFVTLFYAFFCIGLYCLFYANNNIEFIKRFITNNQHIINIIIISMFVLLLVLLILGALVEVANTPKKQKRKNMQSISN